MVAGHALKSGKSDRSAKHLRVKRRGSGVNEEGRGGGRKQSRIEQLKRGRDGAEFG